ncbi:uncharacterized protein An01g10030 [Aspergillus niger]|uniref:Contig An01c0330, genomic contig n=2 Tax=Aspergillus niger TaxID=5061 RepID=A2QA33_ASPNC|nr:uncharacterized protein An01g10030 [Aspergillus niger]CAK37185.1 unnamed protein product [Aspergillus niger]
MATNASVVFDLPPLPTYTLTPRPPVLAPIPDNILALILPIVAYWALSMVYHFIDVNDYFPQYRLHTPAEVLKRNRVTRWEVVRDVLLQQVVQTLAGMAVSYCDEPEYLGGHYPEFTQSLILDSGVEAVVPAFTSWELSTAGFIYWFFIPALQFIWGVCVVDTWQYFLHRAMHLNRWLYVTFHSRHHRLYVPYAFGALYNHPVEGFLLDTAGTGVAFLTARMSNRQSMWFFTFSTIKTVDDHCGYAFPWDPLQHFTSNNAAYHDIHHQSWGIKTNFSQPFFTIWDRWFGTQWKGDVKLRYERSRESAQKQLDNDASSATNSGADTPASGSVTPVPAPQEVPAESTRSRRRKTVTLSPHVDGFRSVNHPVASSVL